MTHWLYKIVPRKYEDTNKLTVITWALLGNEDDGIFGEEETSGEDWLSEWRNVPLGIKRFLAWQIRNPLHNLFFYVIGSTHRKEHTKKEILTLGKRYSDSVLPATFAILLHDDKPFISSRFKVFGREIQFYLGWRERGNFGFAFRIKDR